MALDIEHDRLLIEVSISSRFEISRKIISSKEEVRQITGAHQSRSLTQMYFIRSV